MISRRRFLRTNLTGVAAPLGWRLSHSAGRWERLDSERTSAFERDYWNDWPLYMTVRVEEARARRKEQLATSRTAEQVRQRADAVRARVWALVGGPLEKTPLNARTVGAIEREGYRIEKIIFESQPQVYVTANLYVPTASQPSFCGLVSPPGHYPEGKEARDYQYLFQNLARKGYMVITYDPWGQGERQQYLDPQTGRARYQNTKMHDQAGRPLVLLGATFALYYIWDGIRALDYLLARPEVDPERIGCVGHSGGGTATMFLCALEPRIQVAVAVEGHVRNFASRKYDPPGSIDDAEQNLVGSMVAGLDRADLLYAFAPKPLLITYTPQDVVVSPFYRAAVQEVYEEVRSAYKIFGAEERLSLFTAFLPHRFDFFNRRETYAWFNRWLAKKGSGASESVFDQLPVGALNGTATGQVLTSLGGGSVVQVNRDRMRALTPPGPRQESFREDGSRARENTRNELRALLQLPSHRSPLQPQVLSTGEQADLTIEEFEFRSEPEIRIPGWFLRPRASRKPLPTIFFLAEHSKDEVVNGLNEMEEVVRKGFALCAVGLRGAGITAPRYPSSEPFRYYDGGEHLREDFAWASLVLGRPVLGQRVWDFLRCLDYLETRPEVDRRRIYVFGVRGGGIMALLGTALDERPRALLCERSLVDFRSVFDCEDYSWGLEWFAAGFLRKMDLPDAAAAIAPRPLWMFNPVGPEDETLPESVLRRRLKTAFAAYSAHSASTSLRTFVESEGKRSKVLINWLQST